jgi:hypothetical protein
MKAAEKIKDAKEYEQVFQQYLEICNRAIEQNRNKFPYSDDAFANATAQLSQVERQALVNAMTYPHDKQKMTKAD